MSKLSKKALKQIAEETYNYQLRQDLYVSCFCLGVVGLFILVAWFLGIYK